MITGGLLILNVAQRWLIETLKLKLREGLVRRPDHNWLQPMRAFRLASAGPIGVNPDQRMHEDARHLTELSADLAPDCCRQAILLAHVRRRAVADLERLRLSLSMATTIAIPGYMVWAALIYAGSPRC